jgi:hypothetical protein
LGIEAAVIARNEIQEITTPKLEYQQWPAASGQLCRKAINGSTIAARRAGIKEASNATSSKIVGAPTKVNGSVVLI